MDIHVCIMSIHIDIPEVDAGAEGDLQMVPRVHVNWEGGSSSWEGDYLIGGYVSRGLVSRLVSRLVSTSAAGPAGVAQRAKGRGL